MSESHIQQLFMETIRGDYEDDAPWEAVHKLRQLGTREVFDVATQWCGSDDPLMRARGIDVLAQLGKTVEHPMNSFPDESYSVVTNLLKNERELCPLNSAIAALGHLDDRRAVPLIAQFRSHPNAETRFAVACALGSFPNETLSVEMFLALMVDTDGDVRDWSTFGLGVLGNCDSAEIREALVQRLDDPNEDVREEAMVGLAKRRDSRVLTTVLRALEQSTVSIRMIEAAYLMLGMDNEPEGWNPADYARNLHQQFGV
jgi:HEAT repeat protein